MERRGRPREFITRVLKVFAAGAVLGAVAGLLASGRRRERPVELGPGRQLVSHNGSGH